MGRPDPHPERVELRFRDAVTIVRDNDPIRLDIDPAGMGVGVERVLDELSQGNVRPADQPLTKLPQKRSVNAELGGFQFPLSLPFTHLERPAPTACSLDSLPRGSDSLTAVLTCAHH